MVNAEKVKSFGLNSDFLFEVKDVIYSVLYFFLKKKDNTFSCRGLKELL